MDRSRTLLLVFLLVAPVAFGQQIWTIPGVVKAPGQNATNFVSDVVLTNPGASPVDVLLQFAPALGDLPVLYTLDPGASLTLTDVVASVFGAGQAVGALTVMSDQPLILRGRTYNTASSGTFGVALPVIGDDRFLSEGDTADSLWVDQETTSDRGYRTNIAVVFPDSGGGAATVTLFDALGNTVAQKDFSLDAAGLQQFGVGSFAAGALPVGRARIQVTRGRAAGYCVVVDNVTGDGSLYPFEDLPAGVQDVVLNGVSRAGGQNGTFWRSDARFFNPTDADATVTASFHVAGNANPSPATVTVTVPAGQILDRPDVLGTLMGLPVGSSGALRFRSDTAVAVLCRTSNLDPTGQRPGTFGAQQKAVPLLSYLTSADAGALISGVRQGGAFRTNVGFAAGADGAAYSLTLKSPSGGTLGTATGSLGAFGWTQPNVGGLFSGSIPDGSQVVAKVTSGSLDVYDSSIDNGSGDPVVTPVALLPQSIPSAATIGPAGGAVQSSDGRLTLKVPAGAVSAPTVFSIQAGSTSPPNGADSGYLISPDVSFAKDALLVLAYTRQEILNVEMLGLAYQNGADWYGVTGGSLDVAARTMTVPLGQTRPPGSVRAALADTPGVTVSWGSYRSGQILAGVDTLLAIVPVVAGSAKGIDFTVSGVGPGSAQQRGRGAVKLTRGAPVSSVRWKADFATIDSAGHYTAPNCVPPVNPENVSVAFEAAGRSYRLHGKVEVFPRRWDIKVSWVANTYCSPGGFTMQWGLVGSGSFELDPNFVVQDTSLAPLNPGHLTVQPTTCPEETCGYTTLTIDDGYPAGTLGTVTGGWSVPLNALVVHTLFTGNGIPIMTWSNDSCKPPVKPYSSKLSGFADWIGDHEITPTGLNYAFATSDVVGFPAFYREAIEIKPIKESGCP
jgi:hypothetical protein